jgi:glycerophosphoryl diester phosphodiesterase
MTGVAKQGFDTAKFPRPLILGHRGTGVGPGENTRAGFLSALERGADGVELDVRRTADGALALCHDPELPGLGPVAALGVSDLPDEVPLLEAVLDAMAGRLVNIEVKNLPHEVGFDPEEMTVRAVAGLLAVRGYRDRVVVSSFSVATLRVLQEVEPEVPAGWLTTAAYDQRRALDRVVEEGWQALHPRHETVDAALVQAARAAGVAINVWTVNDGARVRELAQLGVDAIITDDVSGATGAISGGPAPFPG